MERSPIRLPSPLMRHAAMMLDIAIIWAGAALASTMYWGLAWMLHGPEQPSPDMTLVDYRAVLVVTLVFTLLSGHNYRSWRLQSLWQILQPVLFSWAASVLTLTGLLFLSKTSSEISRLWLMCWVGVSLAGMCGVRVLVHVGLRWLRTRGFNVKTLLLVGDHEGCHGVRQALSEVSWTGLKILPVVSPDHLESALVSHGKTDPDEIWLCLSLGDKEGIEAALHALRYCTSNIRLVPDWYAIRLMNHGISEVAGIPMLDLSASPVTGTIRVIKALEDRVGALIILAFACLPMLCIALAIKLTSRGPVLFKQMRHGWNGKPIYIYKFRSMTVHQEAGSQVTQARRNDVRITPLGAFLRRTSLDELPQFINVLQGRMSIVGPRPHAVQHNDHYRKLVPGYMLRHKVKPGITGWAQINGYRGETDTLEKMQKRVEYDLYYIEHLTIWFDLKIIFVTLLKGWTHKNAY